MVTGQEPPPRQGLLAALAAAAGAEEPLRPPEEAVVPVVPTPTSASIGGAAFAVGDGVEGVGGVAERKAQPTAVPAVEQVVEEAT